CPGYYLHDDGGDQNLLRRLRLAVGAKHQLAQKRVPALASSGDGLLGRFQGLLQRPEFAPASGALHELAGGETVHEADMQGALAQTRGMRPEEAAKRLAELDASGQTAGHLGWAMLLSIRSQGFVPREAAYHYSPQGNGGGSTKWIGVDTEDGRRYLLDLEEVSRTGQGLKLLVTRNGREVASASGGGVETLVRSGEGQEDVAGVAGSALKQIEGSLFQAWSGGGAETASPRPQAAALYAGDQTARYRELIEKYAHENGVHPSLAHAVMRRENPWGNNRVASPAGAIGLMQLMPDTAKRFNVDANDPEQNIKGGIEYLGFLQSHYKGNLPLVIAAYNAGEGAVDGAGGIPNYPETVFYVANVSNNYYWLTGRKLAYEPFLSEKARTWVEGVKAY
ncbi:MAG: lytic transglycosylase domain-containing protein, partial [Elusimicrobia bacterium]|nr:lytic transglycosylase domain-containing protein [Elusimicrobiota bacterium]